MKKRMSKILSTLLISALIVSTGGVVQAADAEDAAAQVQAADGEAAPEEAQAEEVKEDVPAAVEEKVGPEEVKKEETKAEVPEEKADEVPKMDMDILSADGAEEPETIDAFGLSKDLDVQATVARPIAVKMAVTGDEKLSESDVGVIRYTQDDVKGNGICGYSQRFDVTAKGTLYFHVATSQGTRLVSFGVYSDEALTQPVDSYKTISGDGGDSIECFKIPGAGTYYMGIYSNVSGTTEVSQIVGAEAIFYNGGDRTINAGNNAVGQKDAQTNYFKFKATKTGYLRVAGDTATSSYRVALCNSSKKALSGETYFSKTPTYGVTKGKTYYIKINSNANSKGGYKFKLDNVKISEKSGKSRAKAVNIKKGKTVKGTIQAGSGQADWYKFKLTGKKNVTINVTTGSNDALKIIVYKGGKKVGNGSRTIYNNATGKLYSSTKWSKGTYYIKVLRANGKSSGYYSLKWK